MKDTFPRMERKFRKMLLERSGEERLKMGCSMHACHSPSLDPGFGLGRKAFSIARNA